MGSSPGIDALLCFLEALEWSNADNPQTTLGIARFSTASMPFKNRLESL